MKGSNKKVRVRVKEVNNQKIVTKRLGVREHDERKELIEEYEQ